MFWKLDTSARYRSPIGILATDDVDALLALEPDCVSYNAFRPDVDHLERILASGCNVVTTMYLLAGSGYCVAAPPGIVNHMQVPFVVGRHPLGPKAGSRA